MNWGESKLVWLHTGATYVVAALGLCALNLGGQLSLPVQVALALGYGVSALVPEGRLAGPGAMRFWNVSVVGFFVLQVLRGLLGETLLVLGVEYAAFLQVTRLSTRRSGRDYHQVALLAFLHFIAATVLTASPLFAGLFVLFALAVPWVLVLSQLRDDLDARRPPQSPRRGTLNVEVPMAVGMYLFRGTLAFTLPLAAVTAVLFLAFPRVGSGFLTFHRDLARKTTGFGSDVRLGGFGVIQEDETVVMRVRPPPVLRGHVSELRLRGTSFDTFAGGRWSRSAPAIVVVNPDGDRYPVRRLPQPTDPKYLIDLERLDEPILFMPGDTVALTIPPLRRGGTSRARHLFRSQGQDFRLAEDRDGSLRYTAHVAGPDLGPRPRPLTERERRRYTQTPPSWRMTSMARRITSGSRSDRERTDRVLRVLRDSGRFRYTLKQPAGHSDDPLESFLFEHRAGHCEYFSTAMALLLRSVGVPTRNVTGFLGGRYNRYGGYYAVRQSDAHSWVEVFLRGRWIAYDPTPTIGGAEGRADGWWSDLQEMFDAVRMRWNQNVVSYDLTAQLETFRKVFASWGSLREAISSSAPESNLEKSGPRLPFGRVGPVALILALVLVVLVGAERWRRHRRRRGAEVRSVSVPTQVYRDLERVLNRHGRPRPTWKTPREHAQALVDEGFVGSEVVAAVTDAYLAARYAGTALTADDTRLLRSRVLELDQRCRKRPRVSTRAPDPLS